MLKKRLSKTIHKENAPAAAFLEQLITPSRRWT
jgi:hypothetical protein